MNSQIKKVLILCNDFPPINSIGAERPYSWYRYFREFGLEPVVITKNWITDGNSGFPLVSNYSSVQKTEFGTIIRSKNHHTPSTFVSKYFGNRLTFIRKSLSFIEILFGYYCSFFDRHRGIYKEAIEYCKNNQFCFSRIKSTQINKRAVRFNQTFEIIKNALIRVCCVHESEDV